MYKVREIDRYIEQILYFLFDGGVHYIQKVLNYLYFIGVNLEESLLVWVFQTAELGFQHFHLQNNVFILEIISVRI